MQLRNLSIEDRKKVVNIKADMCCDERLDALKSNAYDDTVEGIRTLLKTERDFLLVNEEFLDAAMEISVIYNDLESLKLLGDLRELPYEEKKMRARNFIESEYLKRGFVFDYEDYLELLELDDLLLRGTNYNYLLENPYILYSIEYLKIEFSDYYEDRIKDNYLLTILNILLKMYYTDIENVVSIESVLRLFPNKDEEKIITFNKRVE